MKLCVVGTSRTGSTLVRSLLHNHPRLVMFNETHWLPRMNEFYGTSRVRWADLLSIALKTTWHSGRDLFDVNLEYSKYSTKQELIDELRVLLSRRGYLTIREFHEIAAAVCLSPTSDWGDKTPDYGFYMTLVQQLWPECKFLHVVRNGFDTAQSMYRHEGCQLMAAAGYDNWCSLSFDHLYERYERQRMPLEDHIGSWRRRLARIRDEARRLRAGTYMEIRYEQLLARTSDVLRSTAYWLGLTAEPTWLANAAEIVRPPAERTAMPLSVALRLLPEDLIALGEEGGVECWKSLSRGGRRETIDLLLQQATTQPDATDDRAAAAKLGIGVLCRRDLTCDIGLIEAALTAVEPALYEELGEPAVRRWRAWFRDKRAQLQSVQ